jgi:histidyl-tRNA synthetase
VDLDTVGSESPLADSEIIETALNVYKKLGLKVKILINSRELLLGQEKKMGVPDNLLLPVSSSIDKVMKIGRSGVVAEMASKGLDSELGEKLFDSLKTLDPDGPVKEIFKFLTAAGFKEGEDFEFDPFLARGLDYYTGTVFEADAEGYEGGSVGGGGRYDELLPNLATPVKVLVTVFSSDLAQESAKLAEELRTTVPTELYTGDGDLDKQLKYADRKGIPNVAILGPKEAGSGQVTIKNLKTSEQKTLPLDQAGSILLD